MTGLREANNKNSKFWTDIFLDAINMMDIGIDWLPDENRFELRDKQGVLSYSDEDAMNLRTAEQVVDRAGSLGEMWILEDFDDEMNNYGLTDYDEFPESDMTSLKAWQDWKNSVTQISHPNYANDAMKFIANHKFEFEMIDLFLDHEGDVNLDSLKK